MVVIVILELFTILLYDKIEILPFFKPSFQARDAGRIRIIDQEVKCSISFTEVKFTAVRIEV